jgi:hypothetical protein
VNITASKTTFLLLKVVKRKMNLTELHHNIRAALHTVRHSRCPTSQLQLQHRHMRVSLVVVLLIKALKFLIGFMLQVHQANEAPLTMRAVLPARLATHKLRIKSMFLFPINLDTIKLTIF